MDIIENGYIYQIILDNGYRYAFKYFVRDINYNLIAEGNDAERMMKEDIPSNRFMALQNKAIDTYLSNIKRNIRNQVFNYGKNY